MLQNRDESIWIYSKRQIKSFTKQITI